MTGDSWQELKYRAHGRKVKSDLYPSQDESTQALQDLCDSQPDNDRKEDGEIVESFHVG